MKVLITGNMGYIGPVLVDYLCAQHPGIKIVGYDTAFFGHSLVNAEYLPEARIYAQYFGDTREIPRGLFEDVDAVVHLAAISNDPMGNKFEVVTDDVNFKASVRVAEFARDCGVKNFVFASSCSIYGAAEEGARVETDSVNPLTAYARSKVATENAFSKMELGEMVVTALRFSTACGMSDRLRLDLVLNDFVACALSTRKITILSDGSPWRPLIDVKDMSRAIDWAIARNAADGGQYLKVNIGSDSSNFQVKNIAQAVADVIPGTSLSINKDAPPDKRSYCVNFELFRQLAPKHQPMVSLEQSILDIKNGLQGAGFQDAAFRDSQFMRLKVLERFVCNGRLNDELRWQRR
jgi:nucleoside-diphosphate-sugar epimerase